MDVVEWLLESDPSIRWQVMCDLTGASSDAVTAERARVAGEGWGARLLSSQREDGHWDVEEPDFSSTAAARWWQSMEPGQRGTLMPNWTSTTWSLVLLRAFGLDPTDPAARQAVDRVREHCKWEHAGQPFFAGEVEPCINGRTVALGAYFGEDIEPVVSRLLGEQMGDGGWNCEQENGSTRGSFHTTIDVLEGLLEFERAAPDGVLVPEVTAARLRGQEYLLARGMMRRLSRPARSSRPRPQDRGRCTAWTRFSFPTYWHYDVLRGLDYLRAVADAVPDRRAADAVALVKSKRDEQGRWPLENSHPGRQHFAMDEGEGRASRWNTLRAMRVLNWYDE